MKTGDMSDEPKRIVFDTSVILSVAGRPAEMYPTWKAVLDGKLRAFTSEQALDELRDALGRPEIREHYGTSLDPVNVGRFMAGYRAIAVVVERVPARFVVRDDPKDSKFFDLAIEVKADFLVTYDVRHILAVRNPADAQHEELKVLAPGLRLFRPGELKHELHLGIDHEL